MPMSFRQEPGGAFVALPCRYDGGNSPWPTFMPPERVPELLVIRLLAISKSCPHPCTNMPPPPWELLVTVNPSIRDGLQWKLLGKGLGIPEPCAPIPQSAEVRCVVPAGKPAKRVASNGFCPRKSTPFDNTVIPAPSNAPISEGSCNSSARLPLRLASQPSVASSGSRSIWGLLGVAVK